MISIRHELEQRLDLRVYLFCRGFLLTDERQDICAYPFFENWVETTLPGYYLYVHSWQKLTVFQGTVDAWFFMVGHAYNPYTMKDEEADILADIAASEDRINSINQLTGVFFLGILSGNDLEIYTDASAMQSVCYGQVARHVYISSHMRLIGDLKDLRITDYAARLTSYRWYPRMMGNYLPGDLTCFDELTRIIPNTYVTYRDSQFSVRRFYPSHELQMCQDDHAYHAVLEEAASLLRNTMVLIARKWKRPSISLNGGIDSNTTFAAANGIYSRYTAFSYVSMPREAIDAEQAEKISVRFQVPWKRYDIPQHNEDVADFSIFKAILEWNDGGIGTFADSDIRKKIVLIQNDVCDVEV